MKKPDYEVYTARDQIDSRLLTEGIFYMYGEITEENANECVQWLVYENIIKDKKLLTMYINSQGGDIYSSLAVIDMMNQSAIPIRTIGLGSVMSAAFLMFASGTPGNRDLLKNTGVMSHQFSSIEDVGKYHDIKATRKEIDRLDKTMYNILKEATGLDGRTVKNKLLPASDVYLTPEECIKMNIADRIL